MSFLNGGVNICVTYNEQVSNPIGNVTFGDVSGATGILKNVSQVTANRLVVIG